MAVALTESNLEEAVAHAQALLQPHQQKLPERLTAVLENALSSWELNRSTETAKQLTHANLAQQFRYL